MLSIIKKVICGLCAVVVMAAASMTAFADYTYQIDGELCDEVESDYKDINGTEATFETKFGDSTEEKYLSLRFKLFNEYLDAEFWNNDDVTVSAEVKLETNGANVIGCLPGFNSKWGWINPSDYTSLKYGEWVTVSEKGSHYYEQFAEAEPAYILLQVRTNWGAEEQGNVKLSVRNFRITGGGEEVVIQTEASSAAASGDQPASTADTEDSVVSVDPAISENSDPESDGEISDTSDTSDTSEPEASEPEQTTTAATSATTIRTAATVATSSAINYSELYAEPESPVMMIVIIVGAAVVISVGAVIGYLIYRKKKYY